MRISLIGKQRCTGTSKKTGNPYDFVVLHYVCRDRDVIGEAAKTTTIDPTLFAFESIAIPGEYDLDFDCRGRLIDFSPVDTK